MTSPHSFSAARDLPADASCPCGSGKSFGECCGPLLSQRQLPATAEACMRSRYTAYVLRNADHLFRSWHPRTRPESIELETIEWSGLTIARTVAGGRSDDTGQVDFTAHWVTDDGTEADLHEVSNFERRHGRWVYVDGEHHFHLPDAD